MIGMLFSLGSEVVEVRVHQSEIYFKSSAYGAQFVPIEGLHLSRRGVLKEFPELIEDENWRGKAIERLRKKIKDMDNEDKQIEYIKKELTSLGYKPIALQKAGFRPKKL